VPEILPGLHFRLNHHVSCGLLCLSINMYAEKSQFVGQTQEPAELCMWVELGATWVSSRLRNCLCR